MPLRDVAPAGEAASGSSPDAESWPALDTQIANSRDLFDHPSVAPSERAEASSETLLRRVYDDQNACKVRAKNVSESDEASPATIVLLRRLP